MCKLQFKSKRTYGRAHWKCTYIQRRIILKYDSIVDVPFILHSLTQVTLETVLPGRYRYSVRLARSDFFVMNYSFFKPK